MVFWSIVFFTLSFIGLIKGGVFSSMRSKLRELELKKLNGGDEKEYLTEWVKAGCLPLIAMTVLFFAQVVYIINAFDYDPYKFPTIAMIVLIIVGFVNMKKNKKVTEMSETELIIYKAELVKKDKRTFMTLVRSLLWTTYFGYMFYVLVF